jgi:hypothetical protein
MEKVMKEVSKETFWNVIRPIPGIKLQVRGKFPYQVNFVKAGTRTIVGIAKDEYLEKGYPIKSTYLINKKYLTNGK